ncbi:DinB family protein [Cytobacillus dafuensis]|uniref:DinB family protein n=1 Tax=Cytobacillus dafuensis TaxID=1742359 RepID=A0A5B8Z2T2_CYTDA|nr:DinB family protein [Cytobacillus dafuensis]QED47345.1 DinB family protein [Cytobacillus dafuensis]
MKIQEIRNHYETFSEWLLSLKQLENGNWSQPLDEGKWSVGAVISHLLLWDKYSLEKRFPYFEEGARLERFPDFQSVNDKAEEYAMKVSKDELIDELLKIRNQFMSMLSEMSEEKLETSFFIGDHALSIKDYFKDFVEHDIHHQKQVMQSIETIAAKK